MFDELKRRIKLVNKWSPVLALVDIAFSFGATREYIRIMSYSINGLLINRNENLLEKTRSQE